MIGYTITDGTYAYPARSYSTVCTNKKVFLRDLPLSYDIVFRERDRRSARFCIECKYRSLVTIGFDCRHLTREIYE